MPAGPVLTCPGSSGDDPALFAVDEIIALIRPDQWCYICERFAACTPCPVLDEMSRCAECAALDDTTADTAADEAIR